VNEKSHVGRRKFLHHSLGRVAASAAGLMLPSEAVLSAQNMQNVAENKSSSLRSNDAIQISRDLFPQQDLLNQRVQRIKQQIEKRRHAADSRQVRVAAFQMRNHCAGLNGKEENLKRMLAAISAAAGEGVQILTFPEMCLSGYFTPLEGSVEEAVAANHSLADEAGKGRYLTALQQAAARSKMVLAFGFPEKAGNQYFDAVGVIDSTGQWLGVRRKNPLYPMDHETRSFSEPDRSLRSVVLQTRYGKVGISCCFDGESPESIRRMRLDGAEILLWCNAALGNPVLGTSHRMNLAGAHAETNVMWVVCCNAVGRNCSGTSVISSPSGEPLVILSPGEETLGIATIDLRMSEDWSKWRDRLLSPA
jgi:5-aminopentanamidase